MHGGPLSSLLFNLVLNHTGRAAGDGGLLHGGRGESASASFCG